MTPLAAAIARLDFQAGHSPAGCLLTLSKSDWALIRGSLEARTDGATTTAPEGVPSPACATPPPSPDS